MHLAYLNPFVPSQNLEAYQTWMAVVLLLRLSRSHFPVHLMLTFLSQLFVFLACSNHRLNWFPVQPDHSHHQITFQVDFSYLLLSYSMGLIIQLIADWHFVLLA